jgi:hypothetical protein
VEVFLSIQEGRQLTRKGKGEAKFLRFMEQNAELELKPILANAELAQEKIVDAQLPQGG